jgi:competence protein ComEC
MRRRVEARWGALGSTGGVGLARALALGDRSGLPDSTRSAFERLGLAHLLAVSGLHVGLVAGLAGWLTLQSAVRVRAFERLGASRLFCLPMVVAVLAAALYAGLSGAGVSVSRACALLVLVVGLRLAGRSTAPVAALAGIAGGLLARDPAALFDLGAQLSFGSCLALWAGGVWTGGASEASSGLGGEAAHTPSAVAHSAVWNEASRAPFATGPGAVVVRALLATMKVSLVVSLGTVGILGAHGLPPAWLGPIFNSLAIPWTALLTLPGALMALVWTLVGPSGPRSDHTLELLLWPAGALARVAERTAELESVGWLVDRPGSISWIVGAAVGGLGLLAVRRRCESVGVLIWLGLALVGLAPPQAGEALGHAPRVVFFDVGQGDAALVESEAHSILIDTGPGPPDGNGGRRLVRAVRSLGLRSIDVLIVTHADLDHRGGAEHVLARLRPRELWLPAVARLDPALGRLAEQAEGHGARVRWRSAGPGLEPLDPDLALRILWPPVGAAALSRNDGSLVVAVELRATRFLFTADIGAVTERALARREAEGLVADVLKLGHHGSRHSTTAGFLKAVAPRVAVLSAPCQPTRGLPSPVVLERLRTQGIPVAWTGRDGALAVEAGGTGPGEARRDGRGVPRVRAWAPPRPCGGTSADGRVSASGEAGWTPLDEGALGLAGVLGPPERTAQGLLPLVGRGPIEALELAQAAQRGLYGEGGVLGDLFGGLEGPRSQRFRGDDLVQQPDRERSLRVDRARRQQQLRRVTAGNLPGKDDRGMAGRVESEGDLLEGEGRPGHGESDLSGEQQIEASGSGVPVDGRNQGHAQWLRDQRGSRNGTQPLEGLGRHALPARQSLGDRNRFVHVHPGAEALLPGARQDGDADRLVGVDPLPVGRQIAQALEVEGVGPFGSIQGDQRDMRMSVEAFESGRHRAVLGDPEPRLESPTLAGTRSGRLLDPSRSVTSRRDG